MPNTDIVKTIDSIARESGLNVSTIGLRACGDAKLYERAKKRVAQDIERQEKLEAYRKALRASRKSQVGARIQ